MIDNVKRLENMKSLTQNAVIPGIASKQQGEKMTHNTPTTLIIQYLDFDISDPISFRSWIDGYWHEIHFGPATPIGAISFRLFNYYHPVLAVATINQEVK